MIKINKSLLKGSIILMIVFNLYSFLNFMFQLVMARFLSVSEYGVMAALFYFFYFTSIFSESIQTIVAKYSSVEENKGKLKNFIKRSFSKISKYLIIVLVAYDILIIFLSRTLDIPYSLMFLNGFAIVATLVLPVSRGILQGRKRFYSLGGSLMVESLSKLIIGIILIYLGFKVYGAIAAVVIGLLLSILLTFLFMKDITSAKEEFIKIDGIYGYSGSVFLVIFAMLAFYSADLLIAQFIFDKETAGYYSIASVLSKIIFWGAQPISRAMFPISSQQNISDKPALKGTYLNALVLLLICIVPALLIFYYFPDFIVKIFSGKELAESAEILFPLAVATSFLSLANLNVIYRISKGEVKNSFLFGIILAVGIAGLFYFSSSLAEFSIAFIASSALFFLGSLLIRNK